MIVMPSNSTGWFWHCLARETGKLGHLYSPGAQRGPWPWFPYALDNGAFACWDSKQNTFNNQRWDQTDPEWRRLITWAQAAPTKPIWAIVPDVPGSAKATIERWSTYAPIIHASRIPLAVAVQNGMTTSDVISLNPKPEVVAVGGTTDWKWETVEQWCRDFPRVHLLRCNSPSKLEFLESIGCESADGTGWNRGDRKQTSGLENWARNGGKQVPYPLWPHVCREPRDNKSQIIFA